MENQDDISKALENNGRRKLLNRAISGMALFGVGSFLWMLLRAREGTPTQTLTTEGKLDLKLVAEGKTRRIMFNGSPVYVRHRTTDEMAKAERLFGPGLKDPYANNLLRHELDPATTQNRSIAGNPKFIVVIGNCTNEEKCTTKPNSGDFNGWLCPCCSTHYDLAGRVIKGPAPRNLVIPRYRVSSDNVLHLLA